MNWCLKVTTERLSEEEKWKRSVVKSQDWNINCLLTCSHDFFVVVWWCTQAVYWLVVYIFSGPLLVQIFGTKSLIYDLWKLSRICCLHNHECYLVKIVEWLTIVWRKLTNSWFVSILADWAGNLISPDFRLARIFDSVKLSCLCQFREEPFFEVIASLEVILSPTHSVRESLFLLNPFIIFI